MSNEKSKRPTEDTTLPRIIIELQSRWNQGEEIFRLVERDGVTDDTSELIANVLVCLDPSSLKGLYTPKRSQKVEAHVEREIKAAN